MSGPSYPTGNEGQHADISRPLWAWDDQETTQLASSQQETLGTPSGAMPLPATPYYPAGNENRSTDSPRPPWAWDDSAASPAPQAIPTTSTSMPPYAGPVMPYPPAPAPTKRTSMAARLLLVFVLGAILGGAGGYVAHAITHKSSPLSAAKASSAPTATSQLYYIVKHISGATLTCVRTDNGQTMFIVTTAATTYGRSGLSATFSDITPGMALQPRGHTSKQTITATRILIHDDTLSGTVQSVGSDGIIVSTSKGAHVTVAIKQATHILDSQSHQPVDRSTLKAGTQVLVFGSQAPNASFDPFSILVKK